MRKSVAYIIVLFLSSFFSSAYSLQNEEQLLVRTATSAPTYVGKELIYQVSQQRNSSEEPDSFCRYRGSNGKHLQKEKKFFNHPSLSASTCLEAHAYLTEMETAEYQSYIPQLWRKLLFPKHYFW